MSEQWTKKELNQYVDGKTREEGLDYFLRGHSPPTMADGVDETLAKLWRAYIFLADLIEEHVRNNR